MHISSFQINILFFSHIVIMLRAALPQEIIRQNEFLRVHRGNIHLQFTVLLVKFLKIWKQCSAIFHDT